MAKPILLMLFVASICSLGSSHHESPFALGIDEENEMSIVPVEIDEDRLINSNSRRRLIVSKMHELRHGQRTPRPNILEKIRGKDDNVRMIQSASGNKFNLKNAPDMQQTNVKYIGRVVGRKKRSPAPEDGPSFNQEANNNVKNVNNTPSMSQSNVKTNIKDHVPVSAAESPKPLVQKPISQKPKIPVGKANRKKKPKSKDRKRVAAVGKKNKKKDKATKDKKASKL